MLRGLFEKIPSFIFKTVSNPQVNHNFIRSLSRAKRSCSCIEGGLSTRASKFPSSGRDNNERRKENMDVVNNRSTTSNSIPFYRTTSRDGSNNPQYKLHRSRIEEEIRESRIYERYQLEAARPRNRYKFNVEEFGASNFAKDEDALQPKNLKPFHSPDHTELSSIVPKRLHLLKKLSQAETFDNSNGVDPDNGISDKVIANDYLYGPINETSSSQNDEEIPKYEYKPAYTYSNSYIPRPSYSEYINLRRTEINSQNKHVLNTNRDIRAAQWRGYSNISNANEKIPDDVSDKQAKNKFEIRKECSEHTTDQSNINKNVFIGALNATNKSVSPRSRLRRLSIKNGRLVPSYSDYIKSQSTQPNISGPNEVPNKVDNSGTVPTRSLLNQNNTDVEQKRQFSSTPHLNVEKKSHRNWDYHSNSKNYRSNSSSAARTLFSSESAHSVSLISSRTYVMCPAYSDYLKTSHKQSTEVEPNKRNKHLFGSNSVNTLDVGQKCPLSTRNSIGNTLTSPTVEAIESLNKSSQRRSISSDETHIFSRKHSEPSRYTLLNENHSVVGKNEFQKPLLTTDSKQYSSKKKCKPKPDPCEPKKPKKCFLPSTVRLPPYVKCSPQYKPCPITVKCPPRADDCMCVKPKKLPYLESTGCICIDPYVPDKTPGLKRLKFAAPDPPRVCPKPPCPYVARADESLVERPKKLQLHKPQPCECVESPPLVDVPLIRLKKICEPEEECYPPKPCPPPPPCLRADDDLCVKPKKLPIIVAPICPCIDETLKDIPPLKRLNLKSPEPPRICPKPCICHVDCPRADDNLVTRPKSLPRIKAGECPCEDRELVDIEFKRLKCIEEPEECHYTDPCEVPQPRADFGCWEYYVREPAKVCPEIKVKSPKKPCKKTKKIKMRR